MNQEHQQGMERVQDMQFWGRMRGWTTNASGAVKTDKGGWSAGTAVITPRDVPVGLKEGSFVDVSPTSSRGRIAQAWIQQGAPCG